MNTLSQSRLFAALAKARRIPFRYLASFSFFFCISLGAFAQNSYLLATRKHVDTAWTTFTNDTAAFSVKFPNKPFFMRREVPSTVDADSVKYLINLYASVDSTTETSYIVRYNDYPAGTFLNDPRRLLEGFEKDFSGMGKVVGEPKKISTDGVDGWEINITLNQGFDGIIRVYNRGNRIYVLISQVYTFTNGDKASDLFFNSFHLLPFTEPSYYTFQPDSRNFKVQLPARPTAKPDSGFSYSSYLVGDQLYFSTNPNSGGLYSILASRISPYYRADNVDSVFKKTIDLYTSYPDSLVRLDTITVNGIKGREFVTVDRDTKLKKRKRVFIEGKNFFMLTGITDESQLFGKTSDIFFNSFALTKPVEPFDFAASKAEKICTDISSTDTLTAKRASGAISYYDFKNDELPFVYSALRKNYPDDTAENGTRVRLIEKLRDIGTDSTVSILVNLYPGLKGKDEIKAAILNAVPSINSKRSYPEYLKLLTTDPPLKVESTYIATGGLSDSIAFAKRNFGQITPLMKYDNYRPNLLGIAARIAEVDSPQYKKTVSDSYNILMTYAVADIKGYLATKDSSAAMLSVNLSAYARLMSQVKNIDVTKKLTDQYLQGDPKGLYASDFIVARIFNGLPNDPGLIKFHMDSLDTRFDLMKAYYQQKQFDKIPESYRRQDQFAKMCLYKYTLADDDGGAIAKISLLGTINKAGKIYYVFKFSLAGWDDDKSSIGVAGPYIAGSTKLRFDKYYAYTDYEALENNWRLQAEKMIKTLTDVNKQ